MQRERQLLAYETPDHESQHWGWLSVIALVLWSALAGFPGGMLLCVYTCFFSATIYLGHIPSYNNPDPGTLPQRVTFAASHIPLAFVITTFGIAFLSWRLFRASISAPFVVAGATAVLLWVLLVADPVGAFNWFCD